MNLQIRENLVKCENILRNNEIPKPQKSSISIAQKEEKEINFMNEFCSEFLKCCTVIQKYIQTEKIASPQFSETIFLCLNQILCCIRYIGKTVNTEKTMYNILITNRQYFLDRIYWCLSKLNSMFSSTDSYNTEEMNFVQLMDSVLEAVAPYNLLETSSVIKLSCTDKILDCCRKTRNVIDMLLSQILNFANVSLPADQKALTALSQKVLRESLNFQEACTNDNKNQHNLQLAASLLESALYQLEDYLNESLLRLVFHVFVDYSKTFLDVLRMLIKIDSDDVRIDNKIVDFDINIDRILQIGLFAIAFATSSPIKSTVRSCLASLESLEAVLVPSLYCHTDTILEEHFLEEINKFKLAIHKIIDSSAFLTSYSEQLNNLIIESEKKFDKKKLHEVLEMGKLLNEHFQYNSKDLKITSNHKKNYNEFNLMLKECQAVLVYSDQIGVSRIIKRLKIFRSCCNKLKENFNNTLKNNTISNNKNKDVFIMVDNVDLLESQELFATFGISRSIKKILYENKRNRKNKSSISMIKRNSRTSIVIIPNELGHNENKVVNKNTSLRTAMFRRQKRSTTENLCEDDKEKSTHSNGLQITEILEELSNLTSTFAG